MSILKQDREFRNHCVLAGRDKLLPVVNSCWQ
jgi:hypothetical protein